MLVIGAVVVWIGPARLLGREKPEAAPIAPVVTTPAPVVTVPPSIDSLVDSLAGDTVGAATVPPSSAPSAAPTDDAGPWVSMRATTWVNIRLAPDRNSTVIATAARDSVVQLGTARAGWRRIRFGTTLGWVDPRNFVAVGR